MIPTNLFFAALDDMAKRAEARMPKLASVDRGPAQAAGAVDSCAAVIERMDDAAPQRIEITPADRALAASFDPGPEPFLTDSERVRRSDERALDLQIQQFRSGGW